MKVLSLDVFGTLIRFRRPVAQQYLDTGRKYLPSLMGATAHEHQHEQREQREQRERMDVHFRAAYREHRRRWPLYGRQHGVSTEQWWRSLVQQTFAGYLSGDCGGRGGRGGARLSTVTGTTNTTTALQQIPEELFQELYRYYGRAEAYELLPLGERLLAGSLSRGGGVGSKAAGSSGSSSLSLSLSTTSAATPPLPLLPPLLPPLPPPPYLLLSNGDERICGVLRALGLLSSVSVASLASSSPSPLPLVALVVDARTAGHEKPDRAAFEHALERWRQQVVVQGQGHQGQHLPPQHPPPPLRPGDVLHVGDDPVRDVQGARAAGWHAMLVEEFLEMY